MINTININTRQFILNIEVILLWLACLSLPLVQLLTIKSDDNTISVRYSYSHIIFLILATILIKNKDNAKMMLYSLASIGGLFGALYIFSSLFYYTQFMGMKIIQFAIAFCLPWGIVNAVEKHNRLRWHLFKAIATSALIALLLATIQKILGSPGNFVRAGLPNNHVYSVFLVLTLPMLMHISFEKFKEKTNWITLLMLSLITITVKDPGLLVALLIECIVYYGLVVRIGWKKIAITITMMVIAHICLHSHEWRRFISFKEVYDISKAYNRAYYMAMAYPKPLVEFPFNGRQVGISAYAMQMKHEEISPHPMETDPEMLKQRYAEWYAAIRMTMRNPWFGVGIGNYQKQIGQYYYPVPKLNTNEPDMQNGWLVIGSSLGIPAVLILAIILGSGLIRLNKSGKSNIEKNGDYSAALCAISAGILFAGLWAPIWQTGTITLLSVIGSLNAHMFQTSWKDVFRRFAASYPLSLFSIYTGATVGCIFMLLCIYEKQPEQNNKRYYLWREAEDASNSVESPGRLIMAHDASHGAAFTIPEGVGRGWIPEENPGGALTFQIDSPSSGEHRLWARTRWLDGCGNAFFVRVNQEQRLTLGNDAEFGKWHWINIPEISMKKGKNQIRIENREDGVHLDKILITNDFAYTPEGQWEVVWTKNPAEKDTYGWILPSKNPWERIQPANSDEFWLECPQKDLDFPLCKIDHSFDSDLLIMTHCMLKSKQSDLRIHFYYVDEMNYHAISIDKGRMRFIRMHNGVINQIEGVERETPLKQWLTAEIYARNGVIQVDIDGKRALEGIDRSGKKGYIGFSSQNGGSAVKWLDVKPLEGIYFHWKKIAENQKAQRLLIGEDHWCNYSIFLTLTGYQFPSDFRINVKSDGLSYYRVMRKGIKFKIQSIVDNEIDEEREINSDWKPSAFPALLEIQCFDQSVSLRMDNTPIGDVLFSGRNMLRGKIETDTSGLAQIEIKELQRFFDGFGGCDGNNYASWEFMKDDWQIVSLPQMDIVDSFAHLTPSTAYALTGENYWSRYNLSAMLRIVGKGGIALLLHYKDDQNYDAIRLGNQMASLSYAGMIQYVKIRKGEEIIVKEDKLSLPDNEWIHIQFKHIGSSQQVLIGDKTMLELHVDDCSGRVGLFCQAVNAAYFDNITVDFFN